METAGFWEISRGILEIMRLILYWYYVGQVGTIEKGAGRRILGFCLAAVCLALSVWIPLSLSWLLAAGILLLYDLFFDEEPFGRQWRRVLLPGLLLAACALLPWFFQLWNVGSSGGGPLDALAVKSGGAAADERILAAGEPLITTEPLAAAAFLCHGPILFVFFLLFSGKRQSLQLWNGIMTMVSFSAVTAFQWLLCGTGRFGGEGRLLEILLWGSAALETLLFFTVESALYFYKKGFEARTERFRSELMEHSYGEIRDIYMDMRGWRHDYHNHMQVMKAKLSMGDMEGIGAYLDQLERELDRVDTLVRSGNLMTDAILNSKLTLARRSGIQVICKARLPERLPVEDVDLCVILGNLLDNAIEACRKVEEDSRSLRLYMAVNKGQFYLSLQNSAPEEPDFDARHYITSKRGNHGLGMKRVKAAVDKYRGYLNLANEPGIFAAEVTMPLADFS
ncbi:MAG: GHKL domain-containing protein [Lachnospiraceae bacterium]|mgnify:CR=1 FL=1|nr:GHKL domain-containing protein [Lachnospiraceae bacterium]